MSLLGSGIELAKRWNTAIIKDFQGFVWFGKKWSNLLSVTRTGFSTLTSVETLVFTV